MDPTRVNTLLRTIHDNNSVSEKGNRLLFDNHMFMLKPYRDFSKEQVYKKAAQIGATVMNVFKVCYAAKELGLNIIYTMPSDNDIYEFVPSKVNKIIQSNPWIRNNLRQDTTGMKGIGNRFIFFKGTRSKTAPISTTADLLVHDEIDRSDQGIIEVYRSRTKFSEFKGLWQLSNPSLSRFGIDIQWRRSDQKEWFVTCEKCQTEQIIKWDVNVNYQKCIYECANCKKEITDDERRGGRWIKTSVNPDAEVSGYHISQIMAPWLSAKELIKERDTTDDEYFNNFVLGEPVDAGDVERFRQFILDNYTVEPLDKGPYIMGIDVGRIKHYVVGNKDGIFKVGKCETRLELESIIERYNPTVVMDAGPERTWAEEFRQKYPKFYICFFKHDRDKTQMVKWGEDEDSGVVWADRSRTIDAVVNDLALSNILFHLEPKLLEQYIKHWEAIVRRRETSPLGIDRFIWDKATPTAQDHWAFATVYYWLAKNRAQDIELLRANPPKTEIIKQRADGEFYMDDLEDILEDKGHMPNA